MHLNYLTLTALACTSLSTLSFNSAEYIACLDQKRLLANKLCTSMRTNTAQDMVGLLDVLTPLSDCRHETVEKIMGRRISGVSYMCWIDFHNGILGCGFFMCTTNVSLFCVYSVTIYIARAITPRAITPLPPLPGYHAEGYHAPYLPPRAITPVYTSRLPHQSYHASTNTRTSGYHTRY